MSAQLESPHFFRTRDQVLDRGGIPGTVVESTALYAIIAWADGRTEEIDQFDPRVVVIERAEGS